MPLIKILPIDKLHTQATAKLLRIASLDIDLIAQQPEHFSGFLLKLRRELHEELVAIFQEVESLGVNRYEFYASLVSDVEFYSSGKDDEWYDCE